MAEAELLRAFGFRVRLARSSADGGFGGAPFGDGAFAECSGLDVEMEVHDHLEGGRNDAVVRLVGRARYQPLVLKRGMFLGFDGGVDASLWSWLQGVVSGRRPVVRHDGIVEVLDVGRVAARWVFERGLPTKLAGPRLDARTGEIALEELTIAHEGLRLVTS